MTIYTFSDARGIKHDIKQHHIEDAYRTLISAGFDMPSAHELALDYVIARLTVQSIPETDLLYGSHSYQEADQFCSAVATKLAQKKKD